jgi:hypothetical protein
VEDTVLNTERLRGLLAAALVALFVALIAMFLALAGVISMPLAQIVLAFAFIVGTVFICLEALPNSSLRQKIVFVCGLAITLGVLDWWTLKQRRAHVYISRVQFVLGSKSPDPENFANFIYKNEGEMDVHISAYSKVEIRQTFWDDTDKEVKLENQSFAEMLANLSKMSPTDLEHDETELPAHGEGYYSRAIPRTYHEITTMSESIYFMGRITYTDENATHHTDFCKFISQKAEPIHSCKEHNQAP